MGPAQLKGAYVPLPPKTFFVNGTIPWHGIVAAHFFIFVVEADGGQEFHDAKRISKTDVEDDGGDGDDEP